MSQQPGTNPYDPRPYPSYGQGGQYFGPPPDHPQATMVLILGILGLALCQVIAPFAWVIGGRVRKEIAASQGAIGGSQMVTIGWVLGIVGSCFLMLGLLFVIVYIVIFAIAIGASA
ncbi:DUF4190 domain-containing protein [Nocardioides albidus]|uniref:DUF4190 domain-containing protein n=1 Tax=Nocardioides albidus TaxID=1517589 RepID=A0A5C4VLF7_9ACTN|nr:DUF4190 domain-containing protein [Nocardioides albidus]TNM36607.1 DUF4190 domain-containing protein [Nocardioides albidus]